MLTNILELSYPTVLQPSISSVKLISASNTKLFNKYRIKKFTQKDWKDICECVCVSTLIEMHD